MAFQNQYKGIIIETTRSWYKDKKIVNGSECI